MIGRRQFVTGAAAVMAGGLVRSAEAQPKDWQTASPAEVGFAPEMETRLDKLIADKRIWNPHGVIVARHGRIVLERYFAGEENNWARSARPASGRRPCITSIR